MHILQAVSALLIDYLNRAIYYRSKDTDYFLVSFFALVNNS